MYREVVMLILDGTIGSDISAFLARINEDTAPCKIITYQEWLATDSCCNAINQSTEKPEGLVYLRVMPEIAFTRIQKRAIPNETGITIEHIKQVYQQKEDLFIHNKNNNEHIQNLPVLVLNGNIDFQTDFSQFYNHLFYIKKLLHQIQEKKDMAMGIYKEKSPHRHCC